MNLSGVTLYWYVYILFPRPYGLNLIIFAMISSKQKNFVLKIMFFFLKKMISMWAYEMHSSSF